MVRDVKLDRGRSSSFNFAQRRLMLIFPTVRNTAE